MFGLLPEFILSRGNMSGVNTQAKYHISVDYRTLYSQNSLVGGHTRSDLYLYSNRDPHEI